MIRQVIQINEEKCNGCGLCASACHEGAIGIIDGKAKLLRDDYCDGMGDCLPNCPQHAISFIKREAAAYDEAAVKAHMDLRRKAEIPTEPSPCVCPGEMPRIIISAEKAPAACVNAVSELKNFPVQLKLAPTEAPYYQGADLLIAADCTAYAYGAFHAEFIKNRTVLIGCPKLDGIDYSEKLAAIMMMNDIRSVTLTRMTVPCCGGLERMVRAAIEKSGKQLQLNIATIHMNGTIVSRTNG